MRFLLLSSKSKGNMEKKKKGSPCKGCDRTRNCINGLYCTKLLQYVEYVRTKACGIKS